MYLLEYYSLEHFPFISSSYSTSVQPHTPGAQQAFLMSVHQFRVVNSFSLTLVRDLVLDDMVQQHTCILHATKCMHAL